MTVELCGETAPGWEPTRLSNQSCHSGCGEPSEDDLNQVRFRDTHRHLNFSFTAREIDVKVEGIKVAGVGDSGDMISPR
jgi:hypothetical protein